MLYRDPRAKTIVLIIGRMAFDNLHVCMLYYRYSMFDMLPDQKIRPKVRLVAEHAVLGPSQGFDYMAQAGEKG